MRPTESVVVSFEPQARFGRLGFTATLFLLLMIRLAIAPDAHAQFNYTNDNGRITITKYTGPGGAVIIPDLIDGLPVTRIGNSAFYESTQVTDVVIPNSVTTIGSSAFRSCFGLTNVTIGNSVTNIGNQAFSGCALISVVVPDSVITLEDGAFFSSTLTRALIGDGVTSIGAAAFGFCSALKSITIGASVRRIGNTAFGYCTSLEPVYFKGDPPELAFHPFEELDKTIIYYMPESIGWGSTFGGRRTVLWNPSVVTRDANFGVRVGQFGFTITGTSDLVVVVETSSDLANPVWTPVGTNSLAGGSSYFSDSRWAEHPTRVYRLRSP